MKNYRADDQFFILYIGNFLELEMFRRFFFLHKHFNFD